MRAKTIFLAMLLEDVYALFYFSNKIWDIAPSISSLFTSQIKPQSVDVRQWLTNFPNDNIHKLLTVLIKTNESNKPSSYIDVN